MGNSEIYNSEKLEFAVFCIENTALYLKADAVTVYEKLKSTGILEDYIVSEYDILHTQGKDYIINDILDVLKERGIEI